MVRTTSWNFSTTLALAFNFYALVSIDWAKVCAAMLACDVLIEVLTVCPVTMNALVLSKLGPAEQGIFRVPGEGELIKKLKDDVNRGTFVISSSE